MNCLQSQNGQNQQSSEITQQQNSSDQNIEQDITSMISQVNEIFNRPMNQTNDDKDHIKNPSDEDPDSQTLEDEETFIKAMEKVQKSKRLSFLKMKSHIQRSSNSVLNFLEGMLNIRSIKENIGNNDIGGFQEKMNQYDNDVDGEIPVFWFDQIDQFEFQIDDKDFWQSYSDYMKIAAIKDTVSKFRQLQMKLKQSNPYQKAIDQRDKLKEKFKHKKNELFEKLELKIQKITQNTDSAPFRILKDKLSFSLGVIIFGMFSYIMGRWPNDFFYIFYCTFVPLLIIIRFIDYKPKGYHYFLIDFCYFAGAIVLLFIGFYPKSDILYRVSFLYSNGILGVSTAAFSNALIFHQFDNLISLVTHPVPMVCLWNVKQVSMYQERNLLEDQQRFLQHPYDEKFWSETAIFGNFVVPYVLYLFWAVLYYQINFVWKEKTIREKEYITLFKYFNRFQWSNKLIKKSGPKYAPLVFMGLHFVFFTLCHIFGIIAFYSEIAHTILMLIWIYCCVWNGSCYYVKFFQYTKKLAINAALKEIGDNKKNQ